MNKNIMRADQQPQKKRGRPEGSVPRITDCRIGPFPLNVADMRNPKVRVRFDDGTFKELFWFHPDDLKFQEKDFIGLTEAKAMKLKDKPSNKSYPSPHEHQTKRAKALRFLGHY
jgi:hypothetical protein